MLKSLNLREQLEVIKIAALGKPTILTLSHIVSSVPDTNSTDRCLGSALRSSPRCRWACVCPGGCRGKERQTTPRTASSDSSLSCLAKAAAARHPIDLPVDGSTKTLRQDIMPSQHRLFFLWEYHLNRQTRKFKVILNGK